MIRGKMAKSQKRARSDLLLEMVDASAPEAEDRIGAKLDRTPAPWTRATTNVLRGCGLDSPTRPGTLAGTHPPPQLVGGKYAPATRLMRPGIGSPSANEKLGSGTLPFE